MTTIYYYFTFSLLLKEGPFSFSYKSPLLLVIL